MDNQEPQVADEYNISWDASEYIHHEKSPLWYVYFALAAIVVLTGTYFLLHDIISIIVITLMAITVLVFANRQPRALHYQLSDEGIKIDNRGYGYGSFKSFSVMQNGVVESIYLEPVERFMPPISIYFGPDDADKIINIIGQYLPHRERESDFIDKLVHRLRL
jgi:hypothetical protein